jgi:hypothetical protein
MCEKVTFKPFQNLNQKQKLMEDTTVETTNIQTSISKTSSNDEYEFNVVSRSLERPRLSSFLRTRYLGRTFDLEQSSLQQLQSLRKRKVKSSSSSLKSPMDGNAGDSKDFSFRSYFSKPISDCTDPRVTEDMRKLFNRYLKEIMELLGDEQLSGEELHSEAFELFQTLDSDSQTTEQKKLLRF